MGVKMVEGLVLSMFGTSFFDRLDSSPHRPLSFGDILLYSRRVEDEDDLFPVSFSPTTWNY